MLRSLYNWMMRLAASRQGPLWLALVAFCEGIFFPVPTDLMLAPMVLARRDRAWFYAVLTLVASVTGGSVGFAIGHLLTGPATFLLTHTGMSEGTVHYIRGALNQPWAYLLLAVPIPYKLVAILAGMIPLSYPIFLAASVAVRGLRYFAVAGLVKAYGAPIQTFVEKRLGLVVFAVAVAAVLAILALRLLH